MISEEALSAFVARVLSGVTLTISAILMVFMVLKSLYDLVNVYNSFIHLEVR